MTLISSTIMLRAPWRRSYNSAILCSQYKAAVGSLGWTTPSNHCGGLVFRVFVSSKSTKTQSLTQTPQDTVVSTSVKEKVKENVKTSAYGGVVLIGIAVTGAMAYLILSELFSADSPNSIYTKSFKLCKSNTEVQDVLGEPLKCYGEETRRGWRRHVAHQKFLVGDTKYIRMKFYLEGKFNKGTVHLEKKTNANGKFEYSYLVVDVDTYPPRRIELDANFL